MKVPSLRRRLTLILLGSMVALVAVTGVATALVLGEQLRNDLDTRVAERVRLAQTLRSDTPAAQLAEQLSDRDIDLIIGEAYEPQGHHRGPQRAVASQLSDGTPVTFLVDYDRGEEIIARLIGVEAVVGGLAVLALLAVVSWVTKSSLRPVDEMVTAAEKIAAGARGTRLRPEKSGTELGRLATSIDGMVDALETSETRMRRFLADASHELRTPTATIQAAAESFVDDDEPGPERDHRLFDLVAGTHRLSRLVNDLLNLDRLDDPSSTSDHVSLDVVRLIDGAIGSQPSASNISVNRSGIGVAMVDGQPTRLTRLFINLIDNAMRHAPAGSAISVTVLEAGGFVSVQVSDSGPGVAPSDRERIFDRFTRLDTARTTADGGSGLGLAISRAIADEHRATLRCIDPPTGNGATFELRIPLAHP